MVHLRLLLLSTLLLPAVLTYSQSSVWSNPGLQIGAGHFNFYGGYTNDSYLYVKDTILCSTPLLMFESPAGNPVYLRLEAGKVYLRTPYSLCSDWDLLYDFDLVVGQAISAGAGPMLQVVETGQITLLNGESRRWIRLKEPFNGYFVEWVEGIGDVDRGLIPQWGDFEGYNYFVCARDASGDLWNAPSSDASLCDSVLCPLPKPAFSVASADGLTVELLNQSRNADTWVWDFGDGTVSTDWNPQHTYATPGCYNICLRVRSSCLVQEREICHAVPADEERRWKNLPFPAADQGAPLAVSFPHPDTGWVLQSRHIWKTTDGGLNWTEQSYPANPPGVTRTLLNIRMTNTQLGVVTAGNYVSGPGTSPLESSLMVTTDGGATWQDRNQGDHVFIYDAVLRTDGRGYATRAYEGILKTEDYGQTWTPLATPSFLSVYNFLYWQDETVIGNGHRGLGPNFTSSIARSYNGGNDWEYTLNPALPVANRRSTFFSATTGWLPGPTGSLLYTEDAGLSWTSYDYQEDRRIVSMEFADPSNGWAVGEQGLILHTTDGGQNWVRENCGYEANLLDVSAPAPDAAYAVSSAGEVLKYCTGSCMTVIKTRHQAPVAGSLNPFPNPATHLVTLALPDAGRLVWINPLGQVVREQRVEAGECSFLIDALPPGFWRLRLISGEGAVWEGKLVVTH